MKTDSSSTTNDDNALLRQDSVVSIIAPKDGKYIIQLREIAFGGSGNSYYRLHVGTFPRPRITYPLGGQTGQTVAIQYLGDAAGPFTQNIKLPDHPIDNFELFAEQDGRIAPSPNHFRVSDFPSVNEVEPNDTQKTATAYAGALPVAFNGAISRPSTVSAEGEKDAGHRLFQIYRQEGPIARNQRLCPPPPLSTGFRAEPLRFHRQTDRHQRRHGRPRFLYPLQCSAPMAIYYVRMRDHLRAAGEQYAYRIEITPEHPHIALSIPQYTQQYSQERQAVTVHKGNLYATLVRLKRQDVPGGPVTLICPDLPPWREDDRRKSRRRRR